MNRTITMMMMMFILKIHYNGDDEDDVHTQ